MKPHVRAPFDRSACFAGIGILACAFAAVFSTARSADAVQPKATAAPVSCTATGTAACMTVTNTSSGIGISGVSKSGTGLRGTSTSNDGLKATSGSSYGVYGSSTSGAAGVFGTMASSAGVGVLGTNTAGYGTGLEGSSTNGDGIYGTSPTTAVEGSSSSGDGIEGVSTNGSGVEATTSSGDAIYATSVSGAAVYADSQNGYGLIAYSNGNPALYGNNQDGTGADITGSTYGIVGRISQSGGDPMVLTDANNDTVFYVDDQGNGYAKDGFHSFARTRNGKIASAFVGNATEQTVEDTGSAQLVNGTATVALDATFAGAIDVSRAYRVFLTPNGDSNGLFVSGKTPSAFVVHEAKGGRSSIAFDYRIIATAFGHAGERMISGSARSFHIPSAPRLTPKRPVLPAAKIPVLPTSAGVR